MDSSFSIPSGSPVQLGSVVFQQQASPTTIKYGQKQILKTHIMIGGARFTQAMGADLNNITWSGIFLGPDAFDNGNLLASMADGKTYPLTWGSTNINVKVESVDCDEGDIDCHYEISCRVLHLPSTANTTANATQVASNAAAQANNVSLTGNATAIQTPLSGAVTALQTGASLAATVSSFQATLATAQSVMASSETVLSTYGPEFGAVTGQSVAQFTSQLYGLTNASNEYLAASKVNNLIQRGVTAISGV